MKRMLSSIVKAASSSSGPFSPTFVSLNSHPKIWEINPKEIVYVLTETGEEDDDGKPMKEKA